MTPPLPPFCLYINLINCGRNWSLNLAGFSRFLGVFQLWLGHCTSKKPVRGKHCDSSFPDHSPDVFMFLTLCAWRAADMSPAFCFLLGKLASWPYFLIEFCLPRSIIDSSREMSSDSVSLPPKASYNQPDLVVARPWSWLVKSWW